MINGYFERKVENYFIVTDDYTIPLMKVEIDRAPNKDILNAIREVLNMNVDSEVNINQEYNNYDSMIEDDTYNQISYSIKLGCFCYINGYSLEENYNTIKEMFNAITQEGKYGKYSLGEINDCIYTAYIEIKITEPLTDEEIKNSWGCDKYHAWKEG